MIFIVTHEVHGEVPPLEWSAAPLERMGYHYCYSYTDALSAGMTLRRLRNGCVCKLIRGSDSVFEDESITLQLQVLFSPELKVSGPLLDIELDWGGAVTPCLLPSSGP